MQHTTRTQHTWTLEENERFEWLKSTGAHKGHSFIVETVRLEFRDEGPADVQLSAREWLDLNTDELPDNAAAKLNAWHYLSVEIPEDAGLIMRLPLEVRIALADAGLRLPEYPARQYTAAELEADELAATDHQCDEAARAELP